MAIIALGVFLYVLLDGFDLGVGMLYGQGRELTPQRTCASVAILPPISQIG
jgi:cytochrome bd-type quinol oxidase subunit 2